MKKVKYLFILCIAAMLTSGCVKFNAVMDIKKDKSMEFSIIYAFDKSLAGMASMKEEDFDEVKKQGYTVTKYSDDQYEGFKITRSIKNIDDVSTESDVEYNLSGMMEENENNKYIFKVVKGEEKNTYTAKLKFDSNDSSLSQSSSGTEDEEDDFPDEDYLPDEDYISTIDYVEVGDELDSASVEKSEEITTTSESGEITTTGESENNTSSSLDDFDLSGMTGAMDLSFKVNLPKAAISSNATSKENGDKTLVWKLNTKGEQSIEFTFELENNPSDGNLILYIGIGAAVVVVGALVAILATKKKKETPVIPADNQ